MMIWCFVLLFGVDGLLIIYKGGCESSLMIVFWVLLFVFYKWLFKCGLLVVKVLVIDFGVRFCVSRLELWLIMVMKVCIL